jgi:hypothetical protein
LHLGSERIVEKTNNGDGFLSQPNVPQGEYRIELAGSTTPFLIPSMPIDIERHPVRLPYLLFTDNQTEESLPEYADAVEIELSPPDDDEWEDLSS